MESVTKSLQKMLGDTFILKQTDLIFKPPMYLTFLTSYLLPGGLGKGGIYFTEGNICHIGPIKILDLSIFEFFTKV